MNEFIRFINFLGLNHYFCISTKGNNGFKTFWFKRDQVNKAVNLISLNASKNVYISLNSFTYPERIKQNCSNEIYNLFLDFDNENNYLSFIREYNKYCTVIQTSTNKYQVILKLKKPVSKDNAEQITKYLAKEYGSDIAATDCTRIIRMPYTYNHKYTPPFATKLIQYAKSYFFLPNLSLPEKTANLTNCDYDQNSNCNINPNMLKWAKQLYDSILLNTPKKQDGITPDYSIADSRFATKLIRNYSYDIHTTSNLLLHISPFIHERKGKHSLDYVTKTVKKIYHFLTS